MKAKILWIEGKRAESPSFVPDLRKKGYSIETVSSGQAALTRIAHIEPHLVVVDASSLGTSGKRICRALREQSHPARILLIASSNRPATKEPYADLVLHLPFTIRKLANRISHLVPAENENLVSAGPIRLDVESRRVQCLNHETRLTPRLVLLLKTLMQHPGEVLERDNLFQTVWNTRYTGDTRTLDVHISWLRHALEADPRQPRFLKTIRGIGYRLDIE